MVAFTPSFAPVAPGPSAHLFAITPSDTTVLTTPTRAIWVGGAGNLAVLGAADSTAVTLTAVAAGTMVQVCAQKVMATNTTATLLIGMG